MKNLLFFIAIAVLCFGALPVQAQNTEVYITESFDNIRVDKALKKIQKSYDLELAFNSKIFRNYKTSLKIDKMPAIQAMSSIVDPISYEVKLVGSVYVFYPSKTAQEGKVTPSKKNFEWSSYIVDNETLEKLPYAYLTVVSTGETVLTDDAGYFYLFNVPSDTSTIRVSYVGYQSSIIKLSPEIIGKNENIKLERNLNVISQVPIYGRKNPMITLSRDEPLTEIDIKSVRLFPDLGENDLLRVIQTQSGANGTSERSGEINVRGGESDETTIVFDGFNIYHVDHFYNLFSAINSNAVKHVRVHKGWFEPKFGGRTSGIIEITGKEGNENYKETQLDVNFTSASLFFENPLTDGKSTIAISARRSFTDLINSGLYKNLFNNIYNSSIRNNGQSVNTFESESKPDFHFSDINIKYTYRVNESNKLNLSLYYGQDQLTIAYTSNLPEFNRKSTFNDESQWGNIGFSGRWQKSWSRRFHSKLTLGQSTYQSDLFAVDFRDDLFLQTSDTININRKNEVLDRTVVLDNEIYFKQHKFSFGSSLVFNEINFKQIDEEGVITEERETGTLYALYLQDEFRFRKFRLKGGLRLPYFSRTKFEYEPRILASYDLTKMINVHTSFGRNHQFIRRLSRQNLFLNTPDIWVLADNENIPVLRSDQLTIGVTFEKDGFTFKTEAYYRWYIGSMYDISRVPLYFANADHNISIGEKAVKGIDFSLQKTEGRHKGWIGVTLLNINNFSHDLIDYDFTSDHDQLLEFKATYIYRLKGWSFGAQFIYGTGRPYTPAIGTYTLQLTNGTEREILSYADLNSARLPEYHRLDISATKHFLFTSSNQAEIGLSIFNVYGRINVQDVRYYYVEDQNGGGELFQYNIEMLGFLPSLKLKYTF